MKDERAKRPAVLPAQGNALGNKATLMIRVSAQRANRSLGRTRGLLGRQCARRTAPFAIKYTWWEHHESCIIRIRRKERAHGLETCCLGHDARRER